MADTADLDMVDYAILKVLADEGQPLWKKRIHQRLEEQVQEFSMDNSSVQTVGRRVEKLAAEGYVEALITDPENLNRRLVIAYTLTDEGENARLSKQEQLLNQVVKHHIFPDDTDPHLSKEALLAVMQDYFAFSDDIKDQFAEFDHDEIIIFLTIRYARKKTVDVLDDGHISEYGAILDGHNDLLAALGLE